VDHKVTVFKPGYATQTQGVIVSSGQEVKLDFELKAQEGEIRFTVNPPDAELLVDGKSYGPVPESVSLVAVEHDIEIRHPDFKPFTTRLKPRPNFPQEIKTDLIPKHTVVVPPPGEKPVATGDGYAFKLIQPGPFTMGSSRREQGRRSNETLRKIELQRPFYMGVTEVTNGQFRKFREEHNSGSVQTVTLNRDEQPVVNIVWEDAVRSCNWRSEQDGLEPAYREVAGKMLAKLEPGTGYRLATEAEWEYCARVTATGELLKYPWGEGFPPKEKSGNYGDQSASDFVVNPIPDYADGYPGPAPAGSFAANRFGLFDMNGNVSEWTHDVYEIYPYSPTKAYIDPLGPNEAGELWTIRGASYKSSTITNLRYCYRNYAKEKKADVGFRMCRYVE
jgi:formylglycine-generating enzyme required for sulfatase activity